MAVNEEGLSGFEMLISLNFSLFVLLVAFLQFCMEEADFYRVFLLEIDLSYIVFQWFYHIAWLIHPLLQV